VRKQQKLKFSLQKVNLLLHGLHFSRVLINKMGRVLKTKTKE